MALTVHALTKWETVRDELGQTGTANQTVFERIVNAVSEAIEMVAGGRHFERGAAIIERVRGNGTSRLILSRTPIVSIASIERLNQDGTVAETYTASTYEIENAAAGFVYRADGWPWTGQSASDIAGSPLPWTERASLRVTYAGGWIAPPQDNGTTLIRDLPADLEEAAILSAVSLFRRRGQDRQITGQNVTDGPSVNYRSPPEGNVLIGSEPAGLLVQEALDVARKYRRLA